MYVYICYWASWELSILYPSVLLARKCPILRDESRECVSCITHQITGKYETRGNNLIGKLMVGSSITRKILNWLHGSHTAYNCQLVSSDMSWIFMHLAFPPEFVLAYSGIQVWMWVRKERKAEMYLFLDTSLLLTGFFQVKLGIIETLLRWIKSSFISFFHELQCFLQPKDSIRANCFGLGKASD